MPRLKNVLFFSVIGMHLNMAAVMSPAGSFRQMLAAYLPTGWLYTEEEQAMLLPLGAKFSDLLLEMGYMHIQATIKVAQRMIPVFTRYRNRADSIISPA